MGTYYSRDIATEVDGDVAVDSRGDIEVADSAESMKNAMKFIMATDYNEVKTQLLMGANLGSLIGRHDINEVIEEIPGMVYKANNYSRLLDQSDFRIVAIPIDVDKIFVSVSITGTYLDEDGYPLDGGVTYLEYVFPYTAEKIQALS